MPSSNVPSMKKKVFRWSNFHVIIQAYFFVSIAVIQFFLSDMQMCSAFQSSYVGTKRLRLVSKNPISYLSLGVDPNGLIEVVGAVKPHAYTWTFGWLHGSPIDTVDVNKLLMPLNPDSPAPRLILTEATLPGTPPTLIPKEELDRDFLNIRKVFDMLFNRLPLAALVFVSVDLFFFGSKDVYDDEIAEENDSVVGEWVSQTALRAGAAVFVTLLTILCQDLFLRV